MIEPHVPIQFFDRNARPYAGLPPSPGRPCLSAIQMRIFQPVPEGLAPALHNRHHNCVRLRAPRVGGNNPSCEPLMPSEGQLTPEPARLGIRCGMTPLETATDRSHLVHLCVDMQRLFAEDTPWHAPWMRRVVPAVEEIAGALAPLTIFTRFIPPANIEAATGRWKDYYALWPEMVADRLSPDLLELVPSLKRFTPPGRVFDKPVYSPWWSGQLHRSLQARGANALVITGGETDVCVLATVLGAIDLGYHVYLPLDALYGSADATHDAMLEIYRSRFQAQLTITTVDEFSLICREYNL